MRGGVDDSGAAVLLNPLQYSTRSTTQYRIIIVGARPDHRRLTRHSSSPSPSSAYLLSSAASVVLSDRSNNRVATRRTELPDGAQLSNY